MSFPSEIKTFESNSQIFTPSPISQLSPEAQEIINKKEKYSGYLEPNIWVLIREGFMNAMQADSDKAKNELISKVEEKTMGGCRVLELTPNKYNEKDHKVILYVHGGAFTLGSPDFLVHIPAPVADRTGWKVIAVDYPLAPYENTNEPYAHTAVLNVYRELLKEYDHKEIAFLADSAGGSIAFGAALMARDQGLKLPSTIVTYAPWLDMEQTGPTYSDNDRINQTVVLTPENLKSARDAAFGIHSDYSDYVSPIHGNFSGFNDVAVAVYTAGRDLLMQEGHDFANNLKRFAKSVDVSCKEGMWHGYQEHYKLPEAEACAESAARFMLQNMI